MTEVKVTEDQWQTTLIELAQRLGWHVAHFRKARTKRGWVTPVQADGKGFPDLVLVRERVVWIETKSETGKLTLKQRDWAYWLEEAHQECYVFKPSDWDLAVKVLERGRM